ncbi:MAG: hypothetical protein ICV60_05420 [Pyrinomonadaceae bacterium]|nr:hypothetical protein [Pyrinomonadaceae bacterium]
MSLLSSKRTIFAFSFLVLSTFSQSFAQTPRRAPAGGMRAVVVDERLAVLRDEPDFSARLLQRMSRGRMVAILGQRRTPEGVTFYRVAVTRRTRGWLQGDAVVVPGRAGDDERLLRLIRGSEDFDRIVRARIFLDMFTRSPLRPTVLMLYGMEAEAAAVRLSRDAVRRLEEREMTAGGAPVFSYFMNYNGLDRYRRQEIVFTFDPARKQYRYNGAAWREILRRYPQSGEAAEARKRLEALSVIPGR